MIICLKEYIPSSLKREIKRSLMSVWDSLLYTCTRQHVSRGDLKHIIFVCKGNICRSAFAEKYFKQLTNGKKVTIESCGLDVEKECAVPKEAAQVAKEFNVNLGDHRSKGIAGCNFYEADLIVAMEYKQYLRLVDLFPEIATNVCVLRDFATWPHRLFCNIHDPYGQGENDFRRCFRLIATSLVALSDLVKDHTKQ